MKKMIEEKIHYNLNWAYGVEISEIEKDIKKLKELGATHIEIDVGSCYGDYYLDIEAHNRRMETDEEYAKRLKKEDEYKARKEDQEYPFG